MKHKLTRFLAKLGVRKTIAVWSLAVAGCLSMVCAVYYLISTFTKEKEMPIDDPNAIVDSPQQNGSDAICDCKLIDISPCFCARDTSNSLKLTLRDATPVKKDNSCATITESNSRHRDGNSVPVGGCGFNMKTEKIKLKSRAYTKKVSVRIPGLFDIFSIKKQNDKRWKDSREKSIEEFLDLYCNYLENTSVSPQISLHSVSKDDIAVFNLRMPTAGKAGVSDAVVEINMKLKVFYHWYGKKCNVIH